MSASNLSSISDDQIGCHGDFCVKLSLQPIDNKPTDYNVQAVFEGDEPCSATAYGYTPNGTRYVVCTTIQYGFKPAVNSTTLTTESQATQVTTTTKTPEQMQQEAEQGGWLSTWHEFSWWYPWYRLHYIGKYGGETVIDVGIAIFPWADTGYFPDSQLKRKTDEWFMKVLWNVIQGIAVTEFALWATSHGGLLYFALILGGYIVYKVANLFVLNWNSLENLYVSLVSTVVSIAIGAWTGLCSFLPASLQAIAASAESIKNAAFAFLCKIIMIPVNIWLLMMTWNRISELGGA